MAAVVLIWARTGTTSLVDAFANPVWTSDPGFTSLVAVLVALAAFTKSAQFPFHVWLPDAMAAITPVSAYLHAAAVVKAGIFLAMRFSPLFHATPVWNALLIATGLFTSLLGAWFAISQTDLKKLMAYSTVSQLGLIIATIGVGTDAALAAATIHTIAHALFKSGLFMMVGVIDHATHTRDLHRLPPNLYKVLPVPFVLTLLGAASMAGIPPMMGFISKESILAALLDAPGASWAGWAALVVASVGAVITFTYCTKIVLGAFVDGREDRDVAHEDRLLTWTAGVPIVVSVLFVPVIWILDAPVDAATTASLGAAGAGVHLSLWHGLTVELFATVLVIAAGVAIAYRRGHFFKWAEKNPFPFTGAEVIAGIAGVLRRIGTKLNSLTDSDAATRHVAAILATLSAVALGGVLVLIGIGLPAATPGLSRPIDGLLLVLISIAVASVCWSKSRLGATVSLSAVGVLATVQILALGAPDVALTQLLVESLSIIVIMLVLQKLPRDFQRPVKAWRRGSVVIALLVGAGVAGLAWALNGRRGRSDVAEYYLANTYEVTGGHNIVNVILVEFRALDTMGELSVLGVAGVAIIAVLSTVRAQHLDPTDARRIEKAPELMLRPDKASTAWRAIHEPWPNTVGMQLMLRAFVPVLIVVSALLFWRGHNQPGGGFISALVLAAAIGLVYLSTSRDRKFGRPRAPLFLIGGGILTAVGVGLVGFGIKGSFLAPIDGYILGQHLSTSLVFDIGVYVAVVGLMIVAFNLLGTSSDAREGSRERADETVEGELEGPLDTVRGERPSRVAIRTTFLADGEPPREVGR